MLSFAKFRLLQHFKSHPVFCPLSAIRTGVFLNDVKLSILILITDMASKIQNDVIISKTIKKNEKEPRL